jgi:PAS domain S-box-containing protein
MTKKGIPAQATGDLRTRAEDLLAAGKADLRKLPPADILKLVHELQVHQIELEMQNEELRRAQETITETGKRYTDLYDFAPVGYVTLDPQGIIIEVNLTGARLLGVARNTLRRTPFSLFVAPGHRRAFQAYLRQLPADGAIQSCELELHPQQGPAIAASLESLAMFGIEGKVARYHTTITDITRRRNAEVELRRSEEKFRLLYDKAPLGYQSLDADGIIREVNQAWLDILGYSREEVIGRWFGDFLAPSHVDLFPNHFAGFKDTGEVSQADFAMVRQDGTQISVSFSGREAYDHQAGLSGPIACSRTLRPASGPRKPCGPPKSVCG